VYSGLTTAFSVTMIGLGIAMLGVTAYNGGGSVGVVLGLLFVAAGAGRLYILRRTRSGKAD
jgi:hypothetical protein